MSPGKTQWSEIGQGRPTPSKIADVLRLEEVRCTRRGRRLIDRISLSVRPGDMIVLDGARGVGKSTLLGLAAAVIAPERGAVYIGGRNVQALQRGSLPYVRRNVGYLSADPRLLGHETARENVLLALAVRGFGIATAHEHAQAVLDAVGVGEAIGARVSDLSMGERRLVALARALAGAPAVIVLDDPVAGLAGADRAGVLAAIATACASSAAVLCATSDPVFAEMLISKGGEKLTLADGRLVGAVPRMHVIEGRAPDEATDLEGPGLREVTDDDLAGDERAGDARAGDRRLESSAADSNEVQELDDDDLETLSS